MKVGVYFVSSLDIEYWGMSWMFIITTLWKVYDEHEWMIDWLKIRLSST